MMPPIITAHDQLPNVSSTSLLIFVSIGATCISPNNQSKCNRVHIASNEEYNSNTIAIDIRGVHNDEPVTHVNRYVSPRSSYQYQSYNYATILIANTTFVID